MAVRTRNVKVSLNDRIETLNSNAAQASHAKKVFGTVSAILGLVRDKMIRDKDSVQLSDYCFSACETLKTVIPECDTGEIGESWKVEIEGLERVLCEIERTLRRGASTPYIKYKSMVDGYVLQIQQTPGLRTYHALNLPFCEDPSTSQHDPHPMLVDPHHCATISVPEGAYRRLISRTFALHELPSLVDAIHLNNDEREAVSSLPVGDAQVLIDVIYDTLDTTDLLLSTRKKCLKLLYRTCGHHALLPEALKVSARYDQTDNSPCRGGHADVWKGEYRGQDVAVKVLRTYSNRELEKMINRFCKEVVTWRFLQHPNILPLVGVMMSKNMFAMVSSWMQNGDINAFVEKHPDVDRLRLLAGVAEGLIYLHNNEMVHGDLKGANILIDETGRACLADFGLLTIISDPANHLSSSSGAQGGTVRWMSPELIDPERFGLDKSRPTTASDCYALGMVIYETISGKLPFHKDTDYTVSLKVVGGKRPSRGAKFSDNLWRILEQCWVSCSNDRPSIEDILQCLGAASGSSEPHASGSDGEIEMDSDDWDSSDGASSGISDTMTTTMCASTPFPVDSIPTYSQSHAFPFPLGPAFVQADTDDFITSVPIFNYAYASPPPLPSSQQRSNDFSNEYLNNVFTSATDQGRLPPALPDIGVSFGSSSDPYLAHPFQVTPGIDETVSPLVADPLMDQTLYAQAMNGDFYYPHPGHSPLLTLPSDQQRNNDFFSEFLNNIYTSATDQGRLPPALPDIGVPFGNPFDPYLTHPFQVTPGIDRIISSLVADPLIDQTLYAQGFSGDFFDTGLQAKLDSVMVSGPTEAELRYYLALFFSSFVTQMPVLHSHTWTANRTPPLLVEAMQACGALYAKTRVANAFIASTLAQARDPLVAQFAKETATLGDRIYTILAVTLLQMLGLFHQHAEQRSTTTLYHSMLVAMIRRSGIMSEIASWKIPDIDNVSDAAIEEAWRDWAVIEMGKRALCLAFLHDCSHCIYFAVKPIIFPSEFYIPLPCEGSLWNAKTSKDWLKALNKPSLYGTRIDRLRGRTMGDCYGMVTNDHLNFHISPLAHLLLIHAIVVRVHLLGVPKANSPHVNTDMAHVIATCKEVRDRVGYIQSASQIWLKSWKACPEVTEYKDSTQVPFLYDPMPFYWISQVSLIAFVNGFPPFGLSSPLKGDEKYRLMREWFKMIKVLMKNGQQDATIFMDELMRMRLRNWQTEMQGGPTVDDQDGVLGFFPEP